MNYKEAYLSLFNDVSSIIDQLQKAQQDSEAICIDNEAPPLRLANGPEDEPDGTGTEE